MHQFERDHKDFAALAFVPAKLDPIKAGYLSEHCGKINQPSKGAKMSSPLSDRDIDLLSTPFASHNSICDVRLQLGLMAQLADDQLRYALKSQISDAVKLHACFVSPVPAAKVRPRECVCMCDGERGEVMGLEDLLGKVDGELGGVVKRQNQEILEVLGCRLSEIEPIDLTVLHRTREQQVDTDKERETTEFGNFNPEEDLFESLLKRSMDEEEIFDTLDIGMQTSIDCQASLAYAFRSNVNRDTQT